MKHRPHRPLSAKLAEFEPEFQACLRTATSPLPKASDVFPERGAIDQIFREAKRYR